MKVATLVLATFDRNRPKENDEYLTVDHINNKEKDNDAYWNLRWATRKMQLQNRRPRMTNEEREFYTITKCPMDEGILQDETVVWTPHPENKELAIGPDRRSVKNLVKGRLLRIHRCKWKNSNYEDLYFWYKDKGRSLSRFVYECYSGEVLPRNVIVDHKNGSRTDNSKENLEGVSHKENCINRHCAKFSEGRIKKWNINVERLETFKKQNGHCDVPFREGELGHWVSMQRGLHRAGKLDKTREEQLESIGMDWNPKRGAKRKPTEGVSEGVLRTRENNRLKKKRSLERKRREAKIPGR